MWRGISIRKLGQLLGGPLVVETLGTLILAWMAVRVVAMKYPPWQQMLVPAAGAGGYAISSLLAGHWVRPKWAPGLMLGSIVMAGLVGGAAIVLNTYAAFVALALLFGVCVGHYYVPFQINMVHVRPFRTTAWSVAFYCVAWGTGAAIGPFFGAWFEQRPTGHLLWLISGLIAGHIAINTAAMFAPPMRHDQPHTAAFASTRTHRLAGRWCFGAVGLVIRGLYITLWPYLCEQRGWSDLQTGLGMFTMMIPVPIFSMLMARLRYHLKKPYFMFGSMVLGAVSFVGIPLVESYGAALACAAGVGVMEAVVVYHGLYYANLDPHTQSKSVGWMEAIAGSAFITGPLLFGTLAWDTAGAATLRPYAAGAALLATVGIGVAIMLPFGRDDSR